MKIISSRDNPLYKELKLLASSAQARRKAGRTLLDGPHLCDAYLRHAGMPALCIVSDTASTHHEVIEIVRQCEVAHVRSIGLPDPMYQALSQVEHGVGILFLVDAPQLVAPDHLTTSAVLLDGLQDPGNLGSILRSAAAAGIAQVYCSKGTTFAWSPKVLRAGMGAHFVISIFENVDLVKLTQNAKVPILATSSHAQQSIYDTDLSRPVAWLFGHEGQGVSAELEAAATCPVAIPHAGAVESLNVAASAAVCFFEQLRQRRR